MYKISIIPGDGIGKEVILEAKKVLQVIKEKYNLNLETKDYIVGGDAYDKYKVHLPENVLNECKSSNAILFGAVGGPVDEQDSPKWKDVEKNVILKLRKELNLFCNLRPIKIIPGLYSKIFKKEHLLGVDFIILRELVSGIYFGPRAIKEDQGEKFAYDTMLYKVSDIKKIAKIGFEIAKIRKGKLTLVDKANVLDSSRLWREVVEDIHQNYQDIELEFMYVDNAAMQIILNPKNFDVILTSNMFGDILSDLGGTIVASIGLLPSVSLREDNFGLYEPIHGSAPDIAGKGIANPTAMILCVALMFKYTFKRFDIANDIENAVIEVYNQGYRTSDTFEQGYKILGTKEFGDKVIYNLKLQK